jgi:O-methyltransferase
VVTIDRSVEWVAVAKRHWVSAGVDDRIDARIGEADAVLRALAAEGARFDIAFLDVDKARTSEYFEATVGLLASDGLIMVDNTFWHGWVLDQNRNDQDTAGMRSFNDRIAKDGRFEAVVLPIADGLTMVRRRV